MADRGRGRVAAAILLIAVAAGVVHPAGAQTVTGAQLQALAEQATTDPRALAQLRAVRQVDGRPVDVAGALDGAEGPELAARLRTLARGAGAGAAAPVSAAEARGEAAAVLEGRRFKDPRVPRPFQGILRTLGRWLEPLFDPFRWVWRSVDGNIAAQLALVAAVFAGALAISLRLIGRRGARTVRLSGAMEVDFAGLDPGDLEREAAAAEAAGDLDRAVRLRFVAGVVRLDQAGVISYRPSLTTGQLRTRVGSTSFAELARTFDEIAYGGRRADDADVQAAKATWPRILAEAGR